MSLTFHFLKKELRQHAWLIGLFAVLLLIKLLGQTLPFFNQLTSTYFYEVMSVLEKVILFTYFGICGYIGYCNGPMQRECFFATRPVPAISLIVSKLSIAVLLILLVCLKEFSVALLWDMNADGLFSYYLPGLLFGCTLLLLCALWPTLLSLGIGLVSMFILSIVVAILYEKWGPEVYEIHKLSSSLVACLASAIVLGLAIKTGRAQHPACIILYITGFILMPLVGTYTPPAMTIAPAGTLAEAFQGFQKKKFWIWSPSPEGRKVQVDSYFYGDTLQPEYVVYPMATSLTISNGTQQLRNETEHWKFDDYRFYESGAKTRNAMLNYLRQDQGDYLRKFDRKYDIKLNELAQTWPIFRGTIPPVATDDRLTVTAELSHQIHKYERFAQGPYQEASLMADQDKRVSIIKIEEESNAQFSTLWVLVQASPHHKSRSPILMMTSKSQDQIRMDDLEEAPSDGAIGYFSSYLTKVKLHGYSPWETPEDLQIECFHWRYLGTEESPAKKRTVKAAKLFKNKKSNKRESTKTYPLRHTTETSQSTSNQ